MGLKTSYGSAVSRGATAVKTAENETSLADSVLAVGLVAGREPLGHSLWRLVAGNDTRSYRVALVAFVRRVRSRAKRKNWPKDEVERIPKMCKRALDGWLGSTCRACKGRKYTLLEGLDHILSDVKCQVCAGTGIVNRGSTYGRDAELVEILELAVSAIERRAESKVRG